jgi:2-oxoglutarate dehydrogenase complex dehydrogenase (E1) component-like enzyme
MVADKKLRDAVENVMEDMALTIKPVSQGEEQDSPADKQFLIRCTEEERRVWKEAAETTGKTMSAFARDTLNTTASKILYCEHPASMRRSYPWAEFCLACSKRLRG